MTGCCHGVCPRCIHHPAPPPFLLQTSMFNVKTALNDNEMLLAIDDLLDATEDRLAPLLLL